MNPKEVYSELEAAARALKKGIISSPKTSYKNSKRFYNKIMYIAEKLADLQIAIYERANSSYQKSIDDLFVCLANLAGRIGVPQ